jgi:hypothetical protein
VSTNVAVLVTVDVIVAVAVGVEPGGTLVGVDVATATVGTDVAIAGDSGFFAFAHPATKTAIKTTTPRNFFIFLPPCIFYSRLSPFF